MSIPKLPAGLSATPQTRAANALHSMAIRILRRAREADRESGLSPERLSVLSVLAFAGPQTITRLAEMESVSAPAISRIVTALEKSGFAERRRDGDDARTVTVRATRYGKTIVERGRALRVARIADDLCALSPTDLQTAIALAENIISAKR